MNRQFLYLTFFSVALLGFLHQVGSIFFLYWSIDWFDMMMHFLGGLTIGLIFILVFYFSGFTKDQISIERSLVVKTFIFVMLVGIGWEIFEYAFDIANPNHGNYIEDTTLDLVFDALGALTAGLIGKYKRF